MTGLSDLLDTSGFLPHGQSYMWKPEILWLHTGSDIIIGISSISIPLALIYFVNKRQGVSFKWIYLLSAIFLFAYGTIHFFSVLTIWYPLYFTEGIFKGVAALFSLLLAVLVWKVIPTALLQPSQEDMEQKNLELKDLNLKLESMVKERTGDISRLAAIVNSSGDSIIAIDMNSNISNWNPAAEKLYGYSSDEIIGKHISVLSPLDESFHSKLEKNFEKVKAGEIFYLETFHIDEKEQVIPISLTLSPIRREEDREVIGISLISRDITERNNFIEQIDSKQKLLNTVISNVPTGIVFIDSHGRIKLTNRALEEMFEYKEGELLGRPMEDLVCHEDQDLRTDEGDSFWTDLLKNRAGSGIELVGVKKGGSQFPLEINLASVDESNGEILASVVDISGRKREEEQAKEEHETIRKVLELNTDGWWDRDLINPEKKYLSPSFKKLFGYEDHELENSTETWRKLIFPEDLVVAEENLKKHIQSKGKYPYYQKVRYRHKNGATIWVICKGVAFKGKSGKYERMIGVHFDITHQILLDKQLRASNRELKHTNEDIEQFIYTVSHDLKSPLVTCMAFMNFLKKDLSVSNLKEVHTSITEIDKALRQMKLLIHDILEVGRIGSVSLFFERVELSPLINEIVARFRYITGKPVDIKIADDLGSLYGDRKRVITLFENLISNAIKFSQLTTEETPRVTISLKRFNGNNVIEVSDNGPGIEKKYQSKIFELFYRLDQTLEGTGVGLALVKKIVSQHFGEVWVDSKPGEGTKFFVSIPDLSQANINKKGVGL